MNSHAVRKYFEFGALCLLAAAILWWFGRKLDWGQVRQSVSHSNPYLLTAAVLLISLVYLLRALRWGALLRPLVTSRGTDLFAATAIGFAAVFLIGRAGEVVRPVVLPMRDGRVKTSAALVTIMVERIYDMMAVVLMFAINLIWFTPPSTITKEFSRVRLAGFVLLIMGIAGVLALTWFRRQSGRFIPALDGFLHRYRLLPQRFLKLLIGTLEQLARALRVLVDARELAVTIGWTAAVWAVITLANLLVIRAFGIPFGVTETIFVLGWALVGSLVPTPGGAAGAFHAATAAGLIFLGVAREMAAGMAIVMHLIDFGPAVLFGLFYFVRGDLNVSRLRRLASTENVEHIVEDEALVPQNGVAGKGPARGD
ncbi:MAG: lysylphosphatidylglycerol synthase transmembrane domain-containing protein [Pyrinomonadaceae bacterium]